MIARFPTSVLLIAALGAAPSFAASGDALMEAKAQTIRREAERSALRREQERPLIGPDRTPAPAPPGTTIGVAETLSAILANHPGLTRSRRERDAALAALLKRTESERQDAERCWRAAMARRLTFFDEVAAEEERLRTDLVSFDDELCLRWDVRQAWLSWNGSTARVALWSWLLLTASGWLCLLETRRERRRRRLISPGRRRFAIGAGMTAAVLLWLGLLGIVIASLIEWRLPPIGASVPTASRYKVQEALRREEDRLHDVAEQQERDNAILRHQVEADRDRAFRAWATALGLPPDSPLERAERQADGMVRAVLTEAEEACLFAVEAVQTVRQLEKDREPMAPAVAAHQDESIVRGRIRRALTAVSVILAFAAPLGIVGLRWARRRRQERECPRCGVNGTLTSMTELNYVNCRNCGYQLPRDQRNLPRLCFSTVGLSGSGKTHWLAEVNLLTEQQRWPSAAKLVKVPSLANEALDMLARQLRSNRCGPLPTAATEGKYPEPLLVHLQDRDWPASRVLLHLFDFGGEVALRSMDASSLRRQALLMDGFVFFLDPTQSVEPQRKALMQFAEDVRALRGVSMDVPVAVCLSKLDLVPALTEFSTRAKPWLRQLRTTQGQPMGLRLWEARSRLVREALVSLFPGWPLEEELRDYFDRNFLFFPLAAVGMEERELEGPNVKDLWRRTFAPFGIAEPILWLLHRHGYRV